jgi:hypothetical protein
MKGCVFMNKILAVILIIETVFFAYLLKDKIVTEKSTVTYQSCRVNAESYYVYDSRSDNYIYIGETFD